MSYTLRTNCNKCLSKDKCIDSVLVQAAISGIHSVNYANGVQRPLHLGAGSIEIQCVNFRNEMSEENSNK